MDASAPAGRRGPILVRALLQLPSRLRLVATLEFAALDRLPGRRWGPLGVAVLVAVWFAVFRLGPDSQHVFGFGELWQPVLRDVYTESMAFMILALGVGLLGRTPGMLLVVVFCILDFGQWAFVSSVNTGWIPRWDTVVGRLVIDAMLWILVVVIPGMQRRALAFLRARSGSLLVAAAGSAAWTGLLVWVWATPIPHLMRAPFGGFVVGGPTYESVVQVQVNDHVLVAGAATAAFLVGLAVQRNRSPWLADLVPLLGVALDRTPILGRLVRYAVVLAFTLGIITTATDAALIIGALLLGDFVMPWLGHRIGRAIGAPALPSAAGVLVGAVVAGLASAIVFAIHWGPTDISEFLVLNIAISIALLIVPFVVSLTSARSAGEPAPSLTPTGPATTILALGAFALVALIAPAPVAADNCSGFIDCVTTWGAKLSVMVAAIAAFIWGWLKGVFLHKLVGAAEPLASPEGAAAELGQLQSLQDAVAKEILGSTGDMDEFSRIKGLTPAEFAQEAMSGKWDGLMSYGNPPAGGDGGLSIRGSAG